MGATSLAFYVNPAGFDRLTAQAPCCGWMTKVVQPRKVQDAAGGEGEDDVDADSEEEQKDKDKDDGGTFLTIMYDEFRFEVASIAPRLDPVLRSLEKAAQAAEAAAEAERAAEAAAAEAERAAEAEAAADAGAFGFGTHDAPTDLQKGDQSKENIKPGTSETKAANSPGAPGEHVNHGIQKSLDKNDEMQKGTDDKNPEMQMQEGTDKIEENKSKQEKEKKLLVCRPAFG